MTIFLKNLYKLRLFIILVVMSATLIILTSWVLKNYNLNNPLLQKQYTSLPTIQGNIISNNTDLNIYKPTQIEIPSIKVNARIESVGITKDNVMEAPVGPSNVGWYSLGFIPGSNGSSVMSGHFGWKNNEPAVFDNLYKIKKGDEIFIKNSNEKIVVFIVKETKVYNLNADTTNIFISDDGLSHLNLITCSGIWDSKLKTHSDRLVVFADKK